MSKRVGLFAGSFDPPTLGHLDLIQRALHVVDELIVGVGINAEKVPWLPAKKRVELLSSLVPARVTVISFSGLAVDAARERGADVLVRGIRTAADAEMESQMVLANRRLSPGLETVLLVASTDVTHISGRLVRDVHRAGGDVSVFVPRPVADALNAL